jgi:acyl carrier protein
MTFSYSSIAVHKIDCTRNEELAMHAQTSIAGEIRAVLEQHGRLAVPASQLDETSDLYRAGLTSLATVGLMLALEERFEIEFTDGMLGRQTFSSIASIAQAVEKLTSK